MNKKIFKNPKFYIIIVLVGAFMWDAFASSEMEKMNFVEGVLVFLLIVSLIFWVKTKGELHELQEAVFFTNLVTDFTNSEKLQGFEDQIGFGTNINSLRIAVMEFKERDPSIVESYNQWYLEITRKNKSKRK